MVRLRTTEYRGKVRVEYTRSHVPEEIICPLHGVFRQRPDICCHSGSIFLSYSGVFERNRGCLHDDFINHVMAPSLGSML